MSVSARTVFVIYMVTRGYSLSVELDLLIVTLNGIFIALFIVVRIPCIAVRYDTWAPFAAPVGCGSPRGFAKGHLHTRIPCCHGRCAEKYSVRSPEYWSCILGDQMKEEAG